MPHAPELLSYYLILSRGTHGKFRANNVNVVKLLNDLTPAQLVRDWWGQRG